MALWLLSLAGALWVLLPVYVANGGAPLSRGWGPKMDLGATCIWDGRPYLGSSKTWIGFLIGGSLGLLVGIFEEVLILAAPPSLALVPTFATTLLLAIPPLSLLSFGALLGDALGSFVKRRMGYQSGGSAPFLDQLPFVLFPMALVGLLYPSLFLSAFWPNAIVGPLLVGWVVLLTLFLHAGFNWVGYFLHLKRVPW